MNARLSVGRRGRGPQVALLHGFTQTSRSWDPIADRLAEEFELVAVDLPGHGESADVRTGPAASVPALTEVVGDAVWVGYSLGGRYALHVAQQRPEVVRALVLLGATAGIDDPDERAARRVADELLAESIETDGVEVFLDRWLTNPLFAHLPGDRAGRADRSTNTAAGLASSLRMAGVGTQEPTWDRLGELMMPVLVLAGARDEKFCRLGQRLAGCIGVNARFATVPDAGHSAHLEQPAVFVAELTTFLRSLSPRARAAP